MHPNHVHALCARFWDVDANGNYAGTNEIHFATQDANFNVTAMVDTAGTVIERYKYTSYGQCRGAGRQCSQWLPTAIVTS